MSKFNAEQRSALQSARAKNRKLVTALGAAGVLGVKVPKNIVNKIQLIEQWFAAQLENDAKSHEDEAPAADTSETDGDSEADSE